jgi:hypothetical protein
MGRVKGRPKDPPADQKYYMHLQPGQVFANHGLLVHGSDVSLADRRRLGCFISVRPGGPSGPPWPRDSVRILPTSHWICMRSDESYTPMAPWLSGSYHPPQAEMWRLPPVRIGLFCGSDIACRVLTGAFLL